MSDFALILEDDQCPKPEKQKQSKFGWPMKILSVRKKVTNKKQER